jgi:hypothetical protein
MQMTEHDVPAKTQDAPSLTTWLKTETTIRLPNWAFVAGGVVALVLIAIALD